MSTNIDYDSNEYNVGWEDGYHSAIADMVKLIDAIGSNLYDDSAEALVNILKGGLNR